MKNFKVAVIGSGPAGLMAATTLAAAGVQVSLYEKRKGLGRKLLIAGSSGLNITYDAPLAEFALQYSPHEKHFALMLENFSPHDWRKFIETQLGIPTFKGTSRRYFVDGMKASQMLKKWTEYLTNSGVKFFPGHHLSDFEKRNDGFLLRFQTETQTGTAADADTDTVSAVILTLGGGSWEPQEQPLRWIEVLRSKGLGIVPFESGNCGFELDWPKKFLEEAEGKPIKNLVLRSEKGSRAGELVITRYGLEGTPIYAMGLPGQIHLDLKPELTIDELLKKLSGGKENLAPVRRVGKFLKLSEGAAALVFHMTPLEIRSDLKKLAQRLKSFPLVLKARRPLAEAISSSGGLAWSELTAELMLKRYPGVFAAGEMLDWHAPTGGFLIQGSVSEGRFVGQAVLRHLSKKLG